MNKVFNINLGGYPFTIDEDAYAHLENYLSAIHGHFRQSEGYEDITNDIEARMAEIFEEQRSGRPIVTLRDVKEAISLMGTPEEFGAESILEEESEDSSRQENTYRTGKRFFRDPEDQVVGGVCAGIASYLGIQDPIWIRILFILITISGGFGILLYIVLWAIAPEAKTAGDRLSMKGEPINVSNIAKTIEDQFENFSEQFSDLGSSSKKKVESEGLLEETPLRKGFHF
jgi:phage shock protein PspC (stress-responsive transcriptional regulator)